ncbi:hypothetical protein [Lentilitoribacter sp. Alg239-R112]|uniref:phage adaptor protein n=1 Tax=Lentilitoribacter sp. Alg239-R112 TaxID=2305987 RepID=UPI0013A69E93|nr:hypothetical protein [Lentilitoribacter sp. Alg239-R112]
MPISNYTELKTAITEWMDREDLSGSAADFISLAEARLNRRLKSFEVDTVLSGADGSQSIDISSLSLSEPVALYCTTHNDEYEILLKAPGTIAYRDAAGSPEFYVIDGDNIEFNRPQSGAQTYRFVYHERYALSDAAPTNWLLTNHPDVYLAASIVWGNVYIANVQSALLFKQTLDEFIKETRNYLSQNKRGIRSVDDALLANGANRYASNTYDIA